MATRQFFCPIDVTLTVINGKWKPTILYLLKRGPQRFNAFLSEMPGVSHKVLTQQLRALERDGIVERVSDAKEVVTYRMTELGRTLRPALSELAAWGTRHQKSSTKNSTGRTG
jgi:DNA-binding HxlR family transcriptional regulator